MNHPACVLLCSLALAPNLNAATALTIYNQQFAVVRDAIRLDLKAGTNDVRFVGATAWLEPGSVVLRDPSGTVPLTILEQNYRADPVSQETLLKRNEGKVIQFEILSGEPGHEKREIVSGKIIRAGNGLVYNAFGYGFGGQGAGTSSPIIEVDGRLRFSLPGQPLFPTLGEDTILEPTLHWIIETERPARCVAELGYVTGGLSWSADYNLVLPERGDTIDLAGWVTIENDSGTSFVDARIKLMAGDVQKVRPAGGYQQRRGMAAGGFGGGSGTPPPVTEQSFDEYHLYSLERPTTLRDQETKQVEFVRASGVQSAAIYLYDGAIENRPHLDEVLTEPDYGTKCTRKISVYREFMNAATNHLGLALPRGKVRFYRRDSDGQLQFIGENLIDHTPKDELIRLKTGEAFDLVGERKRTDFNINLSGNATMIDATTGLPVPAPKQEPGGPWMDESFAITLRNHKKESVEVRVVEHLYRWVNWRITSKSDDFRKTGAQTIEFPVKLESASEKTITYTVHYSW